MTPTRLRVRFQGLPHTYIAVPWHIPGHDAPFQPLPADATALIIPKTRSLFINRYPDRRSQELTLDEARTWGTADRDNTETIFVRAKSTTYHRFCLRLILNPRKVVRQRASPQYQAYERLIDDAKFHSNYLSEIEGRFVPRHHGIQWGGTPWNELSNTKFNTEANRILIGRTSRFEALHDSRLVHASGGLGWLNNFRHVVVDVHAPGLSQTDALNGKARCYIVSFSEADEDHLCMRTLPILPLGCFIAPEKSRCSEIASVLTLLGFMKRSDKPISPSLTVEWHTKYSERHPDAPNLEVLLAQRAKFFPDRPSIYPNQMRITFDENDEYAAATFTMLDSDEETEPTSGESDTVVGFRSDSLIPESVGVVTGKLQRMQLAHLLLD
ncbi:hypothetical protein C8R46DRAFT_1353890 [Mycena filopes]|nr:hypothetical protein C8R46DRAFT_1353890 [Mycena filopes]